MDFEDFSTTMFAQNFEKILLFLKNKRIILFADNDLEIIKEKCDFSQLDILGVYNSCFDLNLYNTTFCGYKILSEESVKNLNSDYIFDTRLDRFGLLYELYPFVVSNSRLNYLSIFSNIDLPQLNYFEYHITDHCNLNCESCDNFAPIAPTYFADINEFEKDIKELSKKLDVYSFSLLGGEPLLHNNINEFLVISRKYFPLSDIRIITNGILLPSMSEDFFICCRENNIKFQISSYPVLKMHKENYINILKRYDLEFSILNQLYFYNPSLKEQPLCTDSFDNCHLKACKALRNGKLYICTFDCYINYFNKAFNKNFPKSDGVDIYSNSGENIIKCLNHSVELCKHCDISARKDKPWRLSGRNINEWMIK